MRLTCLTGRSEGDLRRALDAALPYLSVETVGMRHHDPQTSPRWWSSSAVVNGELVVKFAWSEVRAERLYREGVILRRLAASAPSLPVPSVVALSADPVLVATRRVEGRPLPWQGDDGLDGRTSARVAAALGDFLATLHGLAPTEILRDLTALPATAQSDTTTLRRRYGRLVDVGRARRVEAWCDWIDGVLSSSGPDVLLHGDLHGHNQLWDFDSAALAAVVDFETCTAGDAHLDFRYLPGNMRSPDFFSAVVAAYETRAPRRIDMDRVMAWHALTVLGDALWRTEAGIALPGGGDAGTYLDDLALRLTALHSPPPSAASTLAQVTEVPAAAGALRGEIFRNRDLREARFDTCTLEGARFRDCNLSSVTIASSYVENLRVSTLHGQGARVIVDDVDVSAYVAAELDRRFPERVALRFLAEPEDYRALFTTLDRLWDETLRRAELLPEPMRHERVDDEWSIVETLRHLVFADDCWIRRQYRETDDPFHPLGVPPTDCAAEERDGLRLDEAASPTYGEVREIFDERRGRLRQLLGGLSSDDLARPRTAVIAPMWGEETHPGGECLRVLLEEYCSHRRYAERDLDVLERRREAGSEGTTS